MCLGHDEALEKTSEGTGLRCEDILARMRRRSLVHTWVESASLESTNLRGGHVGKSRVRAECLAVIEILCTMVFKLPPCERPVGLFPKAIFLLPSQIPVGCAVQTGPLSNSPMANAFHSPPLSGASKFHIASSVPQVAPIFVHLRTDYSRSSAPPDS